MKSRYQGLRVLGTLALVLAWIILILGLLAAFGSWRAAQSVGDRLDLSTMTWAWLAVIPGLLLAIFGFIEFYIIGKVLHLLVGVDSTTLNVQQKLAMPAVADATPGGGAEISGELKRQAKLIASNLEATQALQKQMASLSSRLSSQMLAAPAAAAAVLPAAESAISQVANESAVISEHVVAEVIEQASE
ncbi:MAG: hypothetical protein ABTQ73_01305 [Caldilineales bacterium]